MTAAKGHIDDVDEGYIRVMMNYTYKIIGSKPDNTFTYNDIFIVLFFDKANIGHVYHNQVDSSLNFNKMPEEKKEQLNSLTNEISCLVTTTKDKKLIEKACEKFSACVIEIFSEYLIFYVAKYKNMRDSCENTDIGFIGYSKTVYRADPFVTGFPVDSVFSKF